MAMGDCAAVAGKNLVPLAQVAEQQATYLARAFNRDYVKFEDPWNRLEEDLPLPGPILPNSWPLPEWLFDAKPTFQYKEKGMMSSAGMGGGVMQTNILGTNMKVSE